MGSTAPSLLRKPEPRLANLLRPYWHWIVGLVVLTLVGNGLNLIVPKLIAWAIDSYIAGSYHPGRIAFVFGAVSAAIFVFTYFQSVAQTYSSELVARDLRSRLAAKIAGQDNVYVQNVGAARLLTNFTSDIDSIKQFVAQALVSLVSSAFLIVGASALMFSIDWRLALGVLCVVPLVGSVFVFVLGRARMLFVRSRACVDWLNRVINESIVGASLIRLLNSQQTEYEKFLAANSDALNISLAIIRLFACLIPVITLGTNLATLVIMIFGGNFVIAGSMSLGDFTAFNAYVAMLFFPILVIGLRSNIIAQASAAYGRIAAVLGAPAPVHDGTITSGLRGDITVAHLSLQFGCRKALDDVSFHVAARTRTAILGPSAAGKTQLLYAIMGLIRPESGEILLDGARIDRYALEGLHRQIALVFQDSVIFNLSMRENIAFSDAVNSASFNKALKAAELADFVATLPDGIDTTISERGMSLSGGQKQRVMLARALALEPKVLLLDDFTARVDARTEQRILANVRKNYPDLTLISVTQKISPVEDYDQIVLLMEGRVVALGRHADLIRRSPEYVQIYESQQSAEDYGLRA